MTRHIIAVSGPVCAGKTTLAATLSDRHRMELFKTRHLIPKLLDDPVLGRAALQAGGDLLDRRTRGRWIADGLKSIPEDRSVVIDSVRIKAQIDELRKSFGSRVVHVHLTARREDLASRYTRRGRRARELPSYDAVRANPTERNVEQLAPIADVVIETSRCSPDDVVVRVASHLGLFGRGLERLVDVLVGGQYGSEGKGHVASYLAPEYDVLVRVGGPNAGHKVYEGPGAAQTFHHLPSGTIRSRDARIILGPGAVIWIPRLREEIAACGLRYDRLSIDPQAMLIEERDRVFETKTLRDTIASTAQGVGAATSRKVLRTAARPKVRLARDAPELRPFIRETRPELDHAFANGRKVFLEGTQGTGLSIHHGDYPYVTSRDTTVSGCLADAGIAPSRVRRIIIVCRTYPIRVENPEAGTSGAMTNELDLQAIAVRSGVSLEELRKTERTSTTDRSRRIGEFDWTLLRKAASLNGPSDIALSFADYLSIKNREARRFEQLTPETIRFIEEVERVAGAPVSLVTTRFHYRSIIDRRAW